jgi:hypothetical protein
VPVITDIRYRVDEALKDEKSADEPSTQTQNQHEDPLSKDAAAADNVRVEILPKQTAIFRLRGPIAY